MCKTVQEFGVLENDGTVGGGTSRETRDTPINVGRAGDFDIANSETESSEDFPNGHTVAYRLDTLTRAHTADSLVFKTCEGVRQKRRWPNGVVVGEDDDVGGGVLDAVAHLETFVGKGDCQNANSLGVDLVGEVLQGSEHLFLCDDEDFLGLADEPAVGRLFEFLAGVDGGDDDGDIFRGDIGGVFGEGDWAVGVGCCETNAIP
jgi:hypothetical protein